MRPPAAPRAAILLPIAVLLHQVEEWFWGFPAWFSATLDTNLSPERFLSINALGLLIFVVGTLAAFFSPHMAWIGVSLATLVGVNGLLHGILSLVEGSYSPGTVTGLLLYVPLSAFLLRSLVRWLSRPVFVGAVVLGILLHGLAALSALS